MGSISNIHDTFVRAILADKSLAADYFQNYLPPNVASKLDFSTLTQLSDVYVSEELRKTMSDIVYSCQLKDGKGEVKVSLLLEHKSHPDKYSPIQIGSYIFSGLLKQLEANEKKLSPIIPVLLYHGKRKWEYSTLSDLFKHVEPDWYKYIPNFDYVYTNLGELSDEHVEALGNRFLVASLLALKHAFDIKWLEDNILRIFSLLDDADENLQNKFIVYIFERSRWNEERLIMLIETLPKTLKKTVMSTMDILLEKGKRIGVAEGKKIGLEIGVEKTLLKTTRSMILEGFSVDIICKVLEVNADFVNQVKSEFKK